MGCKTTRCFGPGVVLIVILMGGVCQGQDKKAASKMNESYQRFKSRSRPGDAPALLKDADALKNTEPEQALNKVEEALGISLAQGDVFNEGKSYELLGEINEGIEEWKLALGNYQRAYATLKDSFYTSEEYKRVLRGLGICHLKLAQYPEALQSYQEALPLRLTAAEMQELWLNISEVYYQMGDYDKALSSLDNIQSAGRSKLLSSSQADQSLDNRVQSQMAKIYARKNELGKTEDLFRNSINQLKENKNAAPEEKQSVQDAKEEIAGVLRGQKRYDDEIKLRNQAVEYNLESNNLDEVTKDKVEISKTLVAKGENDAALREAEEAARIAETIENPAQQANAFLSLAGIYEKNGRTLQALAAYRKYSLAVARAAALNENKIAEKESLINKQKSIDELSRDITIGQREDTIEKATVFRQQLIIYGLLLIIVVIAVTSYFIYRNAQASKVANQLLALKSLRSQMNPHFIFNALNSVNQFIAQQDERAANRFLSEFSQLMRLVLENSQEDFIPLEREQEILALYLRLEHYRFRDKFSYQIQMAEDVQAEAINVPPMLIQPYLENAVWHGLRYRETPGKLLLRFEKKDGMVVVEVTDDGIGRSKSSSLKTENQRKHHSTGLKNIEQRLSIINKVYKAHYRVSVEDLDSQHGTRVKIYLPFDIHRNGTT